MYLQNAGTMIIDVLLGIYISLLLIRFISQRVVNANNPVMQTFIHITEPVLRPIRSVVPGLMGLDLAPFVAAFLVTLVKTVLLFTLTGIAYNISGLTLFSLAECFENLLNLMYWLIIARVIVSWVAPNSYHPAIILLIQITNPLSALVQRVIPTFGGLDLSPIFLILAINVIQMTVVQYLKDMAITLLQ